MRLGVNGAVPRAPFSEMEMERFRFLEDAGSGDLTLAVESDTLTGLFQAAGRGLFAAMVELGDVAARRTETVTLSAETADLLLYVWLAELIFLKDAERLLFSRFRIAVTADAVCRLRGTAAGEEADPDRHRLKSDVKAVTLHRFQMGADGDLWRAAVILDL